MRGVAAGAAAARAPSARAGCGALSVPRKKRSLPLVAAATSATAMLFALEHRQAVVVRPDAAGEDRVAVVEQVVRGDRRRRARPGVGTYCAPSFVVTCSSTIFSSGKSRRSGDQVALDEHRLAIEHVDRRIGDLAVDEQHDAFALASPRASL